jgi:hypothetical protein
LGSCATASTSRPPKKSASSAWPGKTSPHNHESRVITGQGTKIMEYVRLLLKAQATRIFRDAGLAAELVGRQLRKPEIPRQVIRISDMGSHARRQACDPIAATAIAESLRIFT